MTDMQWMAALISPRSVAPHPNFRSVDRVTAAGLLALVVRGDAYDWKSLESRLESPLSPLERDLIESAAASSGYGTVAEGAQRLVAIAQSRTTHDRGLSVAATLLASVALAELDEIGQGIDLLKRSVADAPKQTDDEKLLLAALLQQLAMRAAEAGQPFEESRDRARIFLNEVESVRLSNYPTSQGSRWSSVSTNRRILEALGDANQDLFESLAEFPDSRALKRLLRTDQSYLVATMIRHAGTGNAAFVHESFGSFTMSSERSIRSQDPVDSPIWQAVMFFELIGHRKQARSLRAVLGELRILRSEGQTESNHEGLRLLRHAGDVKRLQLALNMVRSGGPLSALSKEVTGIVVNRLGLTPINDVELLTLEAGAQLLDEETASLALDSVLSATAQLPIVDPFRRELPAVQLERLFKTAAALAPVADRVSDVAAHVLESVEQIGTTNDQLLARVRARAPATVRPSYRSAHVLESVEQIGTTDDQLLARAHERALAPLDWNDVDDDVQQAWRAWLTSHVTEDVDAWRSLINMLWPALRQDEFDEVSAGEGPSLDRIANELNAIMDEPERSPSAINWLSAVAAPIVSQQLDVDRINAAEGVFFRYSIDPADIAVALAQHAQADIWEAVTGYLLDPNVPRRSKSAALDRLAASPEKVPEFARDQFAQGAMNLLTHRGMSSPFDPPESDLFPSAVRLMAALDLMTTERLVAAVAVLAAGSTELKLEAARTLSAVAASGSPTPEWALALALQLSSDLNANVRAETGRTLAVSLQRSSFATAVLVRRLVELLAEDGILVPLLVLRGLSDGVNVAAEPVLQRIQELSESHPVFGVRIQARHVLKRLP